MSERTSPRAKVAKARESMAKRKTGDRRWMSVSATVMALALSIGATKAAPEDAAAREIAGMHWHFGPAEPLPGSHSKVILDNESRIITGAEARRLRELADANIPPNLEADAVNRRTGTETMYQFFDEGYVSIADWAEIDADAMLSQLKQSDTKANERRRNAGIAELHTTGWIERPTLNRDTNTVSWIIEAADNDGAKTINAVALKLGRNGFEKVTWIADASSIQAGLDGFRSAIDSHQFDPGYRYVDHVSTDRVAAYGVAGLVAGVLGVKLFKVAGVGLLAAFAKKGAALLLVPLVAAGSWVRRRFGRSRAPS
jgi:uncharacterized membrane-anchored protein